MNLPTERLVLLFGCGIAVAVYLYWSVDSVRQGEGWTSLAAIRASVVLGGAVLMALVLRAVGRANRPTDSER